MQKTLFPFRTVSSRLAIVLASAPFLLTLAGCAGGSSSSSGGGGGTVTPAATSVQVWETTADGAQLLAAQPAVTFGSGTGAATTPIAVTATTKLQPWDGVGGAMTDSSAVVIAALPVAQQATVMQQLFSPTSGAGLNMVRVPMGASDFSASGNYSYDDVAAGTTDPTLANFSIAHDLTNIVPLLQTAKTYNSNLKLIAAPWSPPAWMKTNGSMNGVSGASMATSQVITADFPYLANYFVKFIQGYQAQGLPIYAISAQNEPLNTTSGYPSAILTAADETNFIANNLGPAMVTAGLSSTKIFAMEDNYGDTAYATTLLSSSAAKTYIAGTSFHWYTGVPSAMTTTLAQDQTKGVWFTEATGTITCAARGACPLTAATFSGSGLKYQMQNLVMANIQNYARSVVAWNLALNQNEGPQNNGCYTCIGLVTVNSAVSPAQVYPNNVFYALGHVGKVATSGGNVIATTQGTTSGVQTVGFLNADGTIGLVAFNNASTSTTVTVQWNSKTFDYAIPGGAVVSFKWPTS